MVQIDYIQGIVYGFALCIQLNPIVDWELGISKNLSVDAKQIDLELQETPWSPAYANLVDKFGISWQINTDILGFVSESVTF